MQLREKPKACEFCKGMRYSESVDWKTQSVFLCLYSLFVCAISYLRST